MKANKFVVFLLVVMMTWSRCRASGEPKVGAKRDQQAVVEGNNKFALELYAKLRAKEGNLFFSPYSISTALAMTYAGARGQTAVQMAKTLQFPVGPYEAPDTDKKRQPLYRIERKLIGRERLGVTFGALQKNLNARGKKGAYELSVANALWGQEDYGFLEEFLESVRTNYGGGLHEVDFIGATESTRRKINAWVEKETKNKIKELIKPGVLNALTRLVLTNAIYFKGNWARQFKEERTRQAPFTLADGSKVRAAMMNQKAEFKYMEGGDFQGLELPYVDDELSMIILLPRRVDGLADFERSLTSKKLSEWLGKLRKREVIVSVPKFKMTSQFGLVGVLRAMGMKDAFVPDVADFSGMNGKRDLFISAVVHKAYVDVNEEGTEAAAATGVVVGVTSVGPQRTPVFRADHPFLFLIRDNKTGSILFIGRLMDPKA